MTDSAPPSLNYHVDTLKHKSNRTRTVLTLCALGLSLTAHIAAAIASLFQINLLHRMADGESVTTAEKQFNNLFYSATHFAILAMYIFTVICVLMWMYRAHKNLRPLPQRILLFTPGGAVGWWFCPFLNLVRPFQVMREIYNVSDEGATGELMESSSYGIGLWWFFWIVGNIVSTIGNALGRSNALVPTIDDLLTQTWANMVHTPFYIVSGSLLMWIIYSTEKMQESQFHIQPALSSISI